MQRERNTRYHVNKLNERAPNEVRAQHVIYTQFYFIFGQC